jgi:hypothetical protein
VIFEILKTIFQAMWLTMNAILTAVWTCLPEIMQLKKLLGYFSPAGIVGLYLGVPTGVITFGIFLFKKLASAR